MSAQISPEGIQTLALLIVGAIGLLIVKRMLGGKKTRRGNRGSPEGGTKRPSLMRTVRNNQTKRIEEKRKQRLGITKVTRGTAKKNGGRR